jgi:hypothetical protein
LLDEAARVDQRDIGLAGIGDELPAVGSQAAGKLL